MPTNDTTVPSEENRQVANGLALTPDVRATDTEPQQHPTTYLMEILDEGFSFSGDTSTTSSSIPTEGVGTQAVDIESYAIKFVKPINSEVSGELSGDAKVAASAVHVVAPIGAYVPDLLTKLHAQRPLKEVIPFTKRTL